MDSTNFRTRRVSMRQLEILWDFLYHNREIATGFNRSLQAKDYSRKKWQEIANALNAQGDGACKDWKAWCKYWVDYKAKLKKRNAAVRSSRQQTGGGPAIEQPLTEVEDKFLRILGTDFGQGMPGIRVDPLPEIIPATGTTSDSMESQSILLRSQIFLEEQEFQQINEVEDEAVIIEAPAPVLSPPVAEEAFVPPPEPRRRRRRQQSQVTRENARKLLIDSCQRRTEAAVRSSEAMQNMAHNLSLLLENMQDIKRILTTAFPRAAE